MKKIIRTFPIFLSIFSLVSCNQIKINHFYDDRYLAYQGLEGFPTPNGTSILLEANRNWAFPDRVYCSGSHEDFVAYAIDIYNYLSLKDAKYFGTVVFDVDTDFSHCYYRTFKEVSSFDDFYNQALDYYCFFISFTDSDLYPYYSEPGVTYFYGGTTIYLGFERNSVHYRINNILARFDSDFFLSFDINFGTTVIESETTPTTSESET